MAKSRSARALGVEALEPRNLLAVVINEIHVDPDISTEQVEFIEIYNDSDQPVDVSEWVIDDAVDFVFPDATTLPANGYFVVAQDGVDFQSKFGQAADGVWQVGDKLSNEGETIQLRDGAGNVIDAVDYKIGFPWPTVGAVGRSMELLDPSLPNDVGGSWRSSGSVEQTPQTFVARGATDWSYRKGTSEASDPLGGWRQPGFAQDATWFSGQTPIGYGDNDDNTVLSDMRSNYTSVFLRNTFDVVTMPNALELNLYADDGAVVWINGSLAIVSNVSHPSVDQVPHDHTGQNHEAAWESFTISNASEYLVTGLNTIAVQAFNQSLTSSDFSIDVELKAPAVSGADPTPGARNGSATTVVPPLMRRVEHSPESPVGGDDVVVSMRITDSDGVQSATLEYQIVNPGSYIRLTDAAYETGWISIPMHDDGQGGDAIAGDSIYSATIPGTVNTHRRLIRYRVTASDTTGATLTVPYADDPQPNFAYFVYDGVPDYAASLRPGVLPSTTYSGDTLGAMATYHLIANATDVQNSQYNSSFRGVQFHGTLVYDGVVYDHIEFRNRGVASTYQVGKNKWKLNFTRGHSFKVRDDYGNRREVGVDKINILPGTNPWFRLNRSTEGTVLFEPAAFKLYELAGAPSPRTNYFQFRVIDDASEVVPSDQYAGDFWGLYINIEQPDGRFLDERGLPDGNIFNMHGGVFGGTSQRNQASDQPSNRSDLSAFVNGVNSTYDTLSEWQANLDLPSYFAWNQINHLVNNSDIRVHENVNYYHNQETDRWEIMPWDLDLTFGEAPHVRGPLTTLEDIRKSRDYPVIELQYDNTLRSLTDLLIDSGDAKRVVEELAHILAPNGDLTITSSNQAQWDYHPQKNKKGIWYENFAAGLLPSKTFDGLVQYMDQHLSPGGYGYDFLQTQGNDTGIPNRPSLTYTGPADYPRDGLQFTTSAFSDPNGNGTFAAMQWRMAEVHNADVANYDPTEPYIYEIEGTWDSGEVTTYDAQMTIPSTIAEPGKTYRVRVRMQDGSGNWSHWSEPQEFLATDSLTVSQSPLVISEINYNPGDPTTAELAAGYTDKDQFEFIEILNSGDQPVSLSTARLEQVIDEGVAFDFANVTPDLLYPGERVVVVENLDAFRFRYGDDIPVAGEWSGGLANGDELLTFTVDGLIKHQFEYEDFWHPTTDNGGYTLQVVDATNPAIEVWATAEGWQPSLEMLGTPGAANQTGDFDDNGIVDATDIDLLSRAIRDGRDAYAFDLNQDGVVSPLDKDDLILNVLDTRYGDANLDGNVDQDDFSVWNAHRFQGPVGWASGDFNCDQFVDVSDFNLLKQNRFSLPAFAAQPAVATGATVAQRAHDASNDAASPDRVDVNGDGQVTPLDALIVINELNALLGAPTGARSALATDDLPDAVGNRADVNDDGELSPLDALMVINRLNQPSVDLFFQSIGDADDDSEEDT